MDITWDLDNGDKAIINNILTSTHVFQIDYVTILVDNDEYTFECAINTKKSDVFIKPTDDFDFTTKFGKYVLSLSKYKSGENITIDENSELQDFLFTAEHGVHKGKEGVIGGFRLFVTESYVNGVVEEGGICFDINGDTVEFNFTMTPKDYFCLDKLNKKTLKNIKKYSLIMDDSLESEIFILYDKHSKI